jgi:hypothetical protein
MEKFFLWGIIQKQSGKRKFSWCQENSPLKNKQKYKLFRRRESKILEILKILTNFINPPLFLSFSS